MSSKYLKSVTISLIALKSKRKNAKCEIKEFTCYPGEEKFKQIFTEDNKKEAQEWCKYMTDKGYPYFQVVVRDGTNVPCSSSTPIFTTLHDYIAVPMAYYRATALVQNFMNLYNAAINNGYVAI